MSERSTSPAERILDWIDGALCDHARAVDLPATAAPELIAPSFGVADASAAARLEPGDLPFVARGIRLGRFAVVLGLLPETSRDEDIADTMRRYRNQCVLARSQLSPAAALDLQLIVTGPRGSDEKDVWRAASLAVERDDRVARKLVWLRPADPAADEESFRAFVKRTFLARPWNTDATFSVASLDGIMMTVEPGTVPGDTAGKWIKLAAELKDDPAALIDGLVEVWAKRSAA